MIRMSRTDNRVTNNFIKLSLSTATFHQFINLNAVNNTCYSVKIINCSNSMLYSSYMCGVGDVASDNYIIINM